MISNTHQEETFFEVFDYTLETFKKHIKKNCDETTANRILSGTKKELGRIVPTMGKKNETTK